MARLMNPHDPRLSSGGGQRRALLILGAVTALVVVVVVALIVSLTGVFTDPQRGPESAPAQPAPIGTGDSGSGPQAEAELAAHVDRAECLDHRVGAGTVAAEQLDACAATHVEERDT